MIINNNNGYKDMTKTTTIHRAINGWRERESEKGTERQRTASKWNHIMYV